MHVIVVGGGIGGLTLGLLLHARGIGCEIYEAAPAMRELGVGINVLPHAIAELAGLGLLGRLDEVAVRTRELIYTNRFGQEIWRELRGLEAGYEVPQLSIHRGRLHGVLYRAAIERLGREAVHAGHRLTGFAQDERRACVWFDDGRSAIGDAVIGCDGIHSAVRRQLYPGEPEPVWNGVMAWRGAALGPRLLDGRTMMIAGGIGRKLVVYPVAPPAGERQLINWAVGYRLGSGGAAPPRREDWNRHGVIEEVLPHAQPFCVPGLDLAGLIAASPAFYEYPMVDRDPLPRWSHGRVTLLGDAAHPMYPVGSNGASQAILDARCLADRLAAGGGVDEALAAYDAERRPVTAEIVRANRAGGPERVIDAVEAAAPDGFERIDDVIARGERESIVKGYARLAGFAPDQVSDPWQARTAHG
jgi:2-polyprenyl-6-methoxyphenol hydroxylase-like FAD-dependent oxidoreductase